MDKINWINGQAGGTPISAENLNLMEDNIENAIESKVKVFSFSFDVGVLNGNQDKYDQTYTITNTDIPATYTPIGIVGHRLFGAYSSHCFFSSLRLTDRELQWAIKNTSANVTGSLACSVNVICKEI